MASNSFEIQGFVVSVTPTVQISEKFRKASVVVNLDPSSQWPEFCEFEFKQDYSDVLAKLNLQPGAEVKIRFSVGGRQWDKGDGSPLRTFTSLTGWAIQPVGESVAPLDDGGGWG